MRAALQIWAAVTAFALTLGWLGPALDVDPIAGMEPALDRDTLGEISLLEREARARCDHEAGQNSGYIVLTSGQIACTDKRGRRLRTGGAR